MIIMVIIVGDHGLSGESMALSIATAYREGRKNFSLQSAS